MLYVFVTPGSRRNHANPALDFPFYAGAKRNHYARSFKDKASAYAYVEKCNMHNIARREETK